MFEERTDLAEGPHTQCLDVWEIVHRRKIRRTRLVNVYNQARVKGSGHTIDHFDLSRLIVSRTILAGDFNACSPAWDLWVAGKQNAGPVERLIERHQLIANNNDCQPTRIGKNCRSVIDLTLSTCGVGPLVTWEIDSDQATTSDHEVIVFAWTLLNDVAVSEEATAVPNWNIDRLFADEQAMREAGECWHMLCEGRPLIESQSATVEELETEVNWL